MDEQVEVNKKILKLAATMQEGLEYVKGKVKEGEVEKAFTVLLDITHAFVTVETAMQPFLSQLPGNCMQEKTDRLRSALAAVTDEYEDNKGLKSREILQFILEPAFRNWQEELERTLACSLS